MLVGEAEDDVEDEVTSVDVDVVGVADEVEVTNGLYPKHAAYWEAQKAWLASGAVAQVLNEVEHVLLQEAACAEQNA